MNKTLTKALLVERLDKHGLGLTKNDLNEMVNNILDLMSDQLVRGEKIKLSGFGNFSVNDKAARPGRNPQTSERIIISRRKVLTFKASQKLIKELNS